MPCSSTTVKTMSRSAADERSLVERCVTLKQRAYGSTAATFAGSVACNVRQAELTRW